MPTIVGIFDSGLGAVAVAAAIRAKFPDQQIITHIDSENFPYGSKTPDQIRNIAHNCTQLLNDKGAEIIVIACNTATMHSINSLRQEFSHIHLIGTVPPIKPAATISKSGIIVLSSPQATSSAYLKDLITQHAPNLPVFNLSSLNLVSLIEHHATDSEIHHELSQIFPPDIISSSDTLVLGCTHFYLIRPQLQQFLGSRFHILDSISGITSQLQRIISQTN